MWDNFILHWMEVHKMPHWLSNRAAGLKKKKKILIEFVTSV